MGLAELRLEVQAMRRAVQVVVVNTRCIEEAKYQPAIAAFCRDVKRAWESYQAAMDQAEKEN